MRITEQDNLNLEWYKQSRKNMNESEMKDFNNQLFNEYDHDYGTLCHAVASSTLAHLNNLLYKEGMTGMQASFVTWEIINIMFNIKVGAKLTKFDDMLFPQYEDKFKDNTISSYTFNLLQEKAKESLADSEHMALRVKNHMQSIVDGVVPFGYAIKED